MIFADTKGDLSTPLPDVSVEAQSANLKLTWIHLVIYPWATSSVRVTLLLFYRRLAQQSNKSVLRGAKILLAVQVLYIGLVEGLVGSMCPPGHPEYYWDPVLRTPKCGDPKIHYFNDTIMVLNIILDTATLLLPLRMIWQTKLPRRDRYIVSGLFMLGFSAVSVTVFRLVYYETQNSPTDFSVAWRALPFSYWIPGQLETTIALSTSCVPLLRPLAKKVSDATHLSSGNSSGSSTAMFINSFLAKRQEYKGKRTVETYTDSDTHQLWTIRSKDREGSGIEHPDQESEIHQASFTQ